MKTWMLITAVMVGALFNVPSATHAQGPARPKVAQPACTITGTARNDVLRGTNRADVICGLDGNDVIYGFGGDDILIGGTGHDTLHGGAGNDTLHGSAGNDTLHGGTGNDILHGGTGNDRLDGQAGHDIIRGEAGTDVLVGGDGDDALNGGVGRDMIRPGSGDNSCALDGRDRMVGRCNIDLNPPVFVPIDPVRNVTAGETIVFEWMIEDASPIEWSWIFIGDTAGLITDWCGQGILDTPIATEASSDGTVTISTYQIECAIPANAVNGEYFVELNAVDVFGNYATPVRIVLMVANNVRVDLNPPLIAPVSLTRSVTAGETALFEWMVEDESQIDTSWMFIGGTSGWVTEWCGFAIIATPVAAVASSDGTVTTTTYQVECAIPASAVNGEYLVQLNAVDVFGNYATPVRLVLVVANGSSDDDAPAISQLAASATVVSASDPLTISWRLDDETGISSAGVWMAKDGYWFADPAGRGSYAMYTPPEGVVIPEASGSGVAMQYTQQIAWNSHAVPGRYTVWLSVRDTLGNSKFVQTAVVVEIR
ncbi:MAG: hypothetical protein ACO3F2_09070 [Roseiflexaceae bacterium]